MATSLRRYQVLTAFKNLHRTRQLIFRDDTYALREARRKINEEFRKNIDVKDPAKIEECLKSALDAEILLRTTVVQAVRKDPQQQTYEVRIQPDTVRNENAKLKVGTVPTNLKDDSDRTIS